GRSHHMNLGDRILTSLADEVQNRLPVNRNTALRPRVLFASDLVVLDLELQLIFLMTHQLEERPSLGAIRSRSILSVRQAVRHPSTNKKHKRDSAASAHPTVLVTRW